MNINTNTNPKTLDLTISISKTKSKTKSKSKTIIIIIIMVGFPNQQPRLWQLETHDSKFYLIILDHPIPYILLKAAINIPG